MHHHVDCTTLTNIASWRDGLNMCASMSGNRSACALHRVGRTPCIYNGTRCARTSTSEHEDSVDELKNAAWTLQTEMHQTFEQDAQADVERQRYEAMMKAESDKARELAAAAEQKAAAKRARDKAALGGNKLQAAQQPRSNGPSTSVDSVGQQRHLPSSRARAGSRTSAPAASQSQRSGARSKR